MIKQFLIKKMKQAFYDNEEFITSCVDNFAEYKDNIKILDIGCGDGKKTISFCKNIINNKKCEIHGVDVKNKLTVDGVRFKTFNFEGKKLPFEDNTFDIVVSNQVIEHILNKNLFLEEINRVLKIGGVCSVN